MKELFLILLTIFVFALFLRFENLKGTNMAFDYDQYEDMFYTYKLAVDHKPLIIGRAIYGDPRLHHGVFYYYYNLLPFIVSGGNPYASAYWNIFFNASTVFIIFSLGRSLFKRNLPAILAAAIAAVSCEFIKFSNWLTIDTVAIFTVPLFYLGLWQYLSGKKWGLLLGAASLGISLQTDLSFIYLIPVFLIFWLIFKPPFPQIRLFSLSIFTFFLSILTMILTEIKLNFSGVKTLFNFSSIFDEASIPFLQRPVLFLTDTAKNFVNNLFPQRADLGPVLLISISAAAIFFLLQGSKKEKSAVYFLLLYLFSPAVTLILGYHQKPWFLIGLPPAIALLTGYVLSKLKNFFLIIPLTALIILSNTNQVLARPHKSYELFDSIYDSTSDLNSQLKTVDYTYQNTKGEPFAINAVTYPLYYNGMWAYLYNWYGKSKYGYKPTWLGGDQLHPYNLIEKSTGREKIFFVLISQTPRIPDLYKNLGRIWGEKNGKLIEEKNTGGFLILKYARN